MSDPEPTRIAESVRGDLEEYFARELARARSGPGVDMGGKHNPLPSERIKAAQMVDVAMRLIDGCPHGSLHCPECEGATDD